VARLGGLVGAGVEHSVLTLLDELEHVWPARIASTPAHVRVQFGELLFRRALELLLLTSALGFSFSDERVVRNVDAIKELAVEAAVTIGCVLALCFP
jgi:hypothetical protein